MIITTKENTTIGIYGGMLYAGVGEECILKVELTEEQKKDILKQVESNSSKFEKQIELIECPF